jgi:hypothetical protein
MLARRVAQCASRAARPSLRQREADEMDCDPQPARAVLQRLALAVKSSCIGISTIAAASERLCIDAPGLHRRLRRQDSAMIISCAQSVNG